MKKLLLLTILFILTACAGSLSTAQGTATSIPTDTPVPSATATQTVTPSPTEPFIDPVTYFDIDYVPNATAFQRLDVYLPAEGQGPYPTILAIHGGGFVTLTKGIYSEFANQFAQWGYATVSTNYRLAPDYTYPNQVEDVFCALAWIHENHEEYNLDPQRIIVTGGSAGGYLASMIGTVDNPNQYLENCPHRLPEEDAFQGVVVFYATYDFTTIEGFVELDNLESYWGAKHSEIPPEKLAEMSPITLIDGSEQPFLLIHGTMDYRFPSWMSEEFAAALEEKGVDVELLLLEAPHYFENNPLDHPLIVESFRAMVIFMEKVFEN